MNTGFHVEPIKFEIVFGSVARDAFFVEWLWNYYFTRFGDDVGLFCNFRDEDCFCNLIVSHPGRVGEILSDWSCFSSLRLGLMWVGESERQHLFLRRVLHRRLINLLEPGKGFLSSRDVLVLGILIFPMDNEKKNFLIKELEVLWGDATSVDKVFDWFDGVDKDEKCKLALEMLIKKRPNDQIYTYGLDGLELVKAILDSIVNSAEERVYFISEIRRRWSQNKYRSNLEGKRQSNFILTDKALECLDKIASKHGMRRTQVLEVLLRLERKHGAYLDKMMGAIKSIDWE